MLSAGETRVDQQANTQVNISKSKRTKDTNICLKSHWGELFIYEGGCVKNHLQAGEEEAHFSIPPWHVLQASNTLEVRFLGPVQREPI